MGIVRGCGTREKGGVYACCGLSEHGLPLEEFLLDPPVAIPPELHLANTPLIWNPDPANPQLYHLYIWIGAEHYPYLPDYIEELRRHGASRRLASSLPFHLLTPGQSKMILAHPFALNARWADQRQPVYCACRIAGHDSSRSIKEPMLAAAGASSSELERKVASRLLASVSDFGEEGQAAAGPCLFKTYELIPPPASNDEQYTFSGRANFLRTIGGVTYTYAPTGEDASGLRPGFFARLPLTHFDLIRRDDGSVNERGKSEIEAAGIEMHEEDE